SLLKAAGYTNLVDQFLGADAYSYVFDGQWGYLDHALASATLDAQVAGVLEWHINADEPSVLDYNVENKSAGQLVTLYSADRFRSSDHDPVIIGLDLGGPLAVTLAAFSADAQADRVVITWETVSEASNAGFNLYRGTWPGGPDRQLNAALIPSQSQGSPAGFVYTWQDEADLAAGQTYWYWLEDVSLNGVATQHGPVSVDYVGPTAVTLASVSASPAAAAGAALPWLLAAAGAGAALALGRRRLPATAPQSGALLGWIARAT
ncbi:MAG TPA: hypothetical protein VL334_08485, partial [Anaerolineae bacterium]|nr:hypothetical protein [Anaerolineae bacterium]